MQMCISYCQLKLCSNWNCELSAGVTEGFQIPHHFQVSFSSLGDCGPYFICNIETKLTEFNNVILEGA